MDDNLLLRYSRHILLDELGIEAQERFAAASVLAVGCGGLGCAALPYLAASGVGRLAVADGDEVDWSNLQRQVCYTPADVGCGKNTAMAGYLKRLNPSCRVETYGRLDGAKLHRLLSEYDAVLDCSDNYATRHAVNAAAAAAGKPLVSGAAVRFRGQVAVYRHDVPDAPCYACLFEDGEASDGACATFGVFAPLPGIIGAMQAAETLKLLAGLAATAGSLHCYDALGGTWQTFALAKNPDCRVCGGRR